MEGIMTKYGKWAACVVAIMSLLSIIGYIVITYSDNEVYPTLVANYYLDGEKIVVISILTMYGLTWYIQPDRKHYLQNRFSVICMVCIIPIFAFTDLTMNNPYFGIIGLARYMRFVYSMEIIQQLIDLGNNEVD